jgi:glycosidase
MWFKDAIVYHILVDRFAGYNQEIDWQEPVFMGGNLRGVADKIEYLADLGMNTILLSPINKTTAYHGYHITDFYSVDERYGTEDDLKRLISLVHEKNMRLILDFVPNHCSRKHPLFQEALLDKKSPTRNWFYFNPFNHTYKCFLYYPDLP